MKKLHKFQDFKKVNESTEYEQYKSRIDELINDLLSGDNKYVTWTENRISLFNRDESQTYDGIIEITSVINDIHSDKGFKGFDVRFSIDIVTNDKYKRKDIDIQLNSNTTGKNTIYMSNRNVSMNQEDIDKIVRIVRKLSNYVDIDDRTIDSIIESIYDSLTKK